MQDPTEIIEKIAVEKEVLSTMPRNNAKNVDKYLEKILQLKKEYEGYQENIVKIFNKRFKKATDIKSANEVENLSMFEKE